jgi:hypothetical protein
MFGNLWNRASNYFGNWKKKIQDAMTSPPGDKVIPPAVRRFLNEHGQEEIQSLKVVRTPISSMLDKLLNVISMGGFEVGKQRQNIDEFFHLFFVVNDKYRVEKNQLVKIMNYTPTEKDESAGVPINRKLTINDLLNNAVGGDPESFWRNYSAFNRNCQWWVMRVLTANGLATPELEGFVKQSLDQVIPAVGQSTETASNFITDLGATVDQGVQDLTNGLVALKKGGRVKKVKKKTI